MKINPITRRGRLWQLVALFLPLSAVAPVLAEETLRYAVVSSGNFPLLCDDLRDAPADFLAAGQQTVACDGSSRYVSFVGTVSLEGKQHVELGGRLNATKPALGPSGHHPSVSFSVKRVSGILPAAFAVDAELLLTHERYSSNAGNRFTGSSRVPARPNTWQEVMSWREGTQSLWQYYTPAEGKAPPALTTGDEIVPVYRLEVMLGQLSNEALDKLPRFHPEHRQLIAELGRWRESFSTHVSPDIPFRLATSWFELKEPADENAQASGVNRLTGSIVENPSHFVLKLQYQSPALRKQDRRVTPLGMEDMGTGDWHYQRIEDPPPAEYEVEGAWCDTSWGEKSLGAQCMNVAAYRLTKVSPSPESHPSP